MRKGLLIAAVIAIGALAFGLRWRFRALPPPAAATASTAVEPAVAASSKAFIPYPDALAILETYKANLPEGLKGRDPRTLEPEWPGWIAQHDAGIRGRLARGDENSVVKLWLYGTTFTTLPRATEQQLTALPTRAQAEELLLRRLNDLMAGLASPGSNERLQFARDLVVRQGVDLSTEPGREQGRIYLVKVRERVIAEQARDRRAADAATRTAGPAAPASSTTLYGDRGLSSDTRLAADFALDAALQALASRGELPPRSVRRAAIIGPGLDFTDEAEGYDFYPLQTIQPFALVDSLTRLGLAAPDALRVTTLDPSPRVNAHLEQARDRARTGEAYTVQLPMATEDPRHQWDPALVRYWEGFGDRIGDNVTPLPPPAVVGAVRVRAVRVRPSVTLSIASHDLDIITERLAPLDDQDRFDVIVAISILVSHDAFDQALALSNIAAMLRPGGFVVTDSAITPGLEFDPSAASVTPVYFDRQQNGATLYCYRRR